MVTICCVTHCLEQARIGQGGGGDKDTEGLKGPNSESTQGTRSDQLHQLRMENEDLRRRLALASTHASTHAHTHIHTPSCVEASAAVLLSSSSSSASAAVPPVHASGGVELVRGGNPPPPCSSPPPPHAACVLGDGREEGMVVLSLSGCGGGGEGGGEGKSEGARELVVVGGDSEGMVTILD
jgi:hypothetical protein